MSATIYEKHERTLRRVKANKFPACKSIENLDHLLRENEEVKKNFGECRESTFYQGTVSAGHSKASIFILEQVASEAEVDCNFFIDATFGILPLNYYQLLIIMAEIETKVCNNYTHYLKNSVI